VAAASKKPKCKAGKVAVHKKKRVKVRVAVRRNGRVVGHRRVWTKRMVWACVTRKAVGAGPAADIVAPTAPTALAVTAGDKQLTLRWNASTDNVAVAAYRVYRDAVLVGTPATNAFTDTTLINGATYKYLIVAVDAAGNASTAASIVASPGATKDTTAPSAPPNFIASSGDRQVSLSWDASTDNVKVVFYQVFRDGIPIGAQETRTFTDTGLVNGTTYTYTVFAHDSSDNVSQESMAVATPADTAAPSVPTGLAATPGSGQVSLTWTASTDNIAVTGYQVFRSAGGGAYALIASPTTPYFADTTVTNGTTYSYKVGAVDAAANASAQTAVVTATPLAGADQTAPSVPAGLVATPGSTQVALSWTASTDNVAVTGYRVFRNGVQVAAPTGTTYTDTGLTNGVSYTYTVAAVDAAANASAQSSPGVSATPADTQAPTVPAGLTATGGNAQVALTWNASTDNVGVTGYRVYRSSGGGAYSQIATPATTFYSDTTVTNGTAYSYKVAAVDAAANVSAQSTAATATPGDTTPPSVPTIIAVTKNNAAHTITITWTASTDNVAVLKYKVYRSKNGAAATVAGQPSTLSYVENGLSNGATYAYQVSAVDTSNNESALSPVVSTYVS
jgi:fibronectin type 3 domain-containing protein